MSSGLKVSRARARHYQWGQGVDAWHLLNHADMSVIEELMPAGASDEAHWHTKARQFFYVLEGVLTLVLADLSVEVGAGEGLHIAPGQLHQARNAGDKPARFLIISSPHSHGDRVEAEASP